MDTKDTRTHVYVSWPHMYLLDIVEINVIAVMAFDFSV